MAEGIFTVRIDPEKQQQIDQLARQLDRSRNYIVGQAIEEFLEAHAWQVEKIKAGLAAANRGEFASEAEMEQVFSRYRPEPGDVAE